MLKFNRTCWAITWNGNQFLDGCQIEYPLLFLEAPPTFSTKKDALRYAEKRIDIWKENGHTDEDTIEKIKIIKVRVNIEAA